MVPWEGEGEYDILRPLREAGGSLEIAYDEEGAGRRMGKEDKGARKGWDQATRQEFLSRVFPFFVIP
jgi:hypothetical protein